MIIQIVSNMKNWGAVLNDCAQGDHSAVRRLIPGPGFRYRGLTLWVVRCTNPTCSAAAAEEIKARANEKRWTIDYRCINSNQPPLWPLK